MLPRLPPSRPGRRRRKIRGSWLTFMKRSTFSDAKAKKAGALSSTLSKSKDQHHEMMRSALQEADAAAKALYTTEPPPQV